MLIVGLTGGISCGKSTVSNILKLNGAAVVDLDEIARRVVQPGRPAFKKIVAAFSEEILLPDGTINREMLGAKIFADRALRRQLNSFTHLPIMAELLLDVAKARAAGASIVVLDAPLLFETSLHMICACTVVVHVKELTQLSRLCARDGLSKAEAEQRIASQMPLASKAARADYLIDNDGAREATSAEIETVLARLDTRAGQWTLMDLVRAALLSPVLHFVALLWGKYDRPPL